MVDDGSKAMGMVDARLVAGLLGEAAGRESVPDVAERVVGRLAELAATRRVHRTRWSTAALLTLGLGALAWIAVRSRDAADDPPADPPAIEAPQDPVEADPLPTAVVVLALSEAPDDARNVRLEVVGEGEGWFEGIEKLTRLERLELGDARSSPGRAVPRPRTAQVIQHDAFAPLTDCGSLRILQFRGLAGIQATHVASLAGLPALRALHFDSSGEKLDPALAGAIAQLPALESLDLRGSPVTTEGLERLARIESLRELGFRANPGLDAKGMAVIASIGHLRSLALRQIDNAMNMFTNRGAPTGFKLLDPEFLKTLPALEHLDLADNLIFPERVAALPKSLRSLSLAGVLGLENGIEGFAAALLALPELRSLEFHAGTRPSEFARLAKKDVPFVDPELAILEQTLTARLFERLVIGRLPQREGPLAEALAAQSLLRELRITWSMSRGESEETLDLGFAAHLANLEVLVLDIHHGQAAKRLDALDFAPLAELPKLRRLVLPGWRGRHLNRAREALRSTVEVSH